MESLLVKVLIVLTSTAQMGDTGKPTGFWLAELTHPYFELVDNGIEVDIASINGGEAPIDPKSLNLEDESNKRFMEDAQLAGILKNTPALSEVETNDYEAIIFAGGHGTMWDFPDSDQIQAKAIEIYQQGGIVAAICHGPAALLNLKLPNGQYLIEGRQLTGYTNEEEFFAGLSKTMPFLLEDKLKERGAEFSNALPWSKKVVVDGRLITGQNPRSATAFGKALVKNLKNKQIDSPG